jgi:ABC-type branched-subunit amino acid transport system ATPase component
MLKVSGVEASFGAVHVLRGVALEAREGEITAVIGPNGAGKTTLFDTISGYVRPSAGDVHLNGRSILGEPPHRIARNGLSRTFQVPRLFTDLPVLENLMVAGQRQLGESPWRVWLNLRSVQRQESEIEKRAWDVAEFLDLKEMAGELASDLSGGQQKLVELGRALMTDPSAVLLDEPVAGVSPSLAVRIGERLDALKSEGHAMVLIEHNMEFVMRHADTVFVLALGEIISSGSPDVVRSDPAVLEAYLGAGR